MLISLKSPYSNILYRKNLSNEAASCRAALSERLFMLFYSRGGRRRCVHKTKHHTDGAARFLRAFLSCMVFYHVSSHLYTCINCILFFLRYKPVKYAAVIPFGRRLSPPAASQIHKNLAGPVFEHPPAPPAIFPPGKAAKPRETAFFMKQQGCPDYSKKRNLFFFAL